MRSLVNIKKVRALVVIANMLCAMPVLQFVGETESSESVVVPPGIWVSSSVEIHSETDLEAGGEMPVAVDVLAIYSERLGRYRVSQLTVRSLFPDQADITGTVLRTLRVQEAIRAVGTVGAPVPPGYYDPAEIARTAGEELERARRRGPTDRILWSVAFVYRAAEIANDSPAARVATVFDLQSRTASNWVRRARELGMFATMAPGIDATRQRERDEPIGPGFE